jgi:hypothetical protein
MDTITAKLLDKLKMLFGGDEALLVNYIETFGL